MAWNRSRLLAILLMIISFTTLSGSCQGLLVRMSLADLWNTADVVLVGTVGDITTLMGDRGMIYRSVNIQVERYQKNPLNVKEVAVIVLGGQIGEFGCWVEDQPGFTQGERVLVYLKYYMSGDSSDRIEGYYVVGGPQGKFTITEGIARNEVGDSVFISPFEVSLGMKMMLGSATLAIVAFVLYRSRISTLVRK